MGSMHPVVAPYAGRLIDVDSHEHLPAQIWVESFGEILRPFADAKMAQAPGRNRNHPNLPGYPGDVAAITADNVWGIKGPGAPGAVDIHRRLDVMDEMRIDRQLVFPTTAGLYGMLIYTAEKGDPFHAMFGDETWAMGRKMIDANNRWMIDAARVSPRIRPVATLLGATPDELVASACDLIAGGIRAVMVNVGVLLGGRSPAHNDLDPLYELLAAHNVAFTFHVGGEMKFLSTTEWGKASAFDGYKINDEISLDPWCLSFHAVPAQNYVATMVMGGVFDRHPTLRVGALEFGAHWIGPLADQLDFWHENNSSLEPTMYKEGQMAFKLPMRPSDYIRRNVRVSPYDIEPVGRYIAKYDLEDVYCFATDYPHVEGGRDPIGRFADSLVENGHSERVIEKFFVTNGEWLLPE